MEKLRKILLTPYFGDFPPWMDKFEWPEGYDHILDTDLEGFKKRVRDKLGIEFPGTYGSSKVWDYRCALGLLYEEEIKGFDYWGHCDFDMVFGDVDKWFTDEILNGLDIWSNHDTYVCGCWSLYRNNPIVNRLFSWDEHWKDYMTLPTPNGWVEKSYSRLVEGSGLKYKYSFFQGDPYHPPFTLKKEKGKLYQSTEKGSTRGVSGTIKYYYEFDKWVEIPMIHFRRSKIWPLNN